MNENIEFSAEIKEQVAQTVGAIQAAVVALAERLKPAIETLTETYKQLTAVIADAWEFYKKCSLYPNKRVLHLARYGKGRTKKKNIHRIQRWIEREAKRREI